MTLIEELRQAAHYTALDHHRDLLERAAADVEAKTYELKYCAAVLSGEALNKFSLIRALEFSRSALSTQGEKT